jgi:hypothetical protein
MVHPLPLDQLIIGFHLKDVLRVVVEDEEESRHFKVLYQLAGKRGH